MSSTTAVIISSKNDLTSKLQFNSVLTSSSSKLAYLLVSNRTPLESPSLLTNPVIASKYPAFLLLFIELGSKQYKLIYSFNFSFSFSSFPPSITSIL